MCVWGGGGKLHRALHHIVCRVCGPCGDSCICSVISMTQLRRVTLDRMKKNSAADCATQTKQPNHSWYQNKGEGNTTMKVPCSSLASFSQWRCTVSQNKHLFIVSAQAVMTSVLIHSSPPLPGRLLTCPSSSDPSNASPCTRGPLGTARSCHCLPRKPRGRKSRFYHRLDCRCLQWGELL